MASTTTIMDFLAGLDNDGLKSVADYLAYKGTTGQAAKPLHSLNDLDAQERMYWGALVEVSHILGLGMRDLYDGAAANIIQHKDLGRRKFTSCASALDTYVSHHAGVKLTATHKRAICIEVLSCLVRWMQRRGQPNEWITPAAICHKIGELPQAVQSAYPDYAKARLLHVIVPRPDERISRPRAVGV